jgi:hypothetical protein
MTARVIAGVLLIFVAGIAAGLVLALYFWGR